MNLNSYSKNSNLKEAYPPESLSVPFRRRTVMEFLVSALISTPPVNQPVATRNGTGTIESCSGKFSVKSMNLPAIRRPLLILGSESCGDKLTVTVSTATICLRFFALVFYKINFENSGPSGPFIIHKNTF